MAENEHLLLLGNDTQQVKNKAKINRQQRQNMQTTPTSPVPAAAWQHSSLASLILPTSSVCEELTVKPIRIKASGIGQTLFGSSTGM